MGDRAPAFNASALHAAVARFVTPDRRADERDAVRALADDVAGLRARVEALEKSVAATPRPKPRAKRRLARGDRPALAALLPAIAACVPDEHTWTVRELFDHAEISPPLMAALTIALGGVNGGASRRLGRLLLRASGTTVAGVHVDRVGNGRRDGAEWMLRVLKTRENSQRDKLL